MSRHKWLEVLSLHRHAISGPLSARTLERAWKERPESAHAGDSVKGFEDVHLEVKARIWP